MSVPATWQVTRTLSYWPFRTTEYTLTYTTGWSTLPTTTAARRINYQEESNKAWRRSGWKLAVGLPVGFVGLGFLLCLVYWVSPVQREHSAFWPTDSQCNRKKRPRNTGGLPQHADQNQPRVRQRDIDVIRRAADPSTIPGVIGVNYAEGSRPVYAHDYGENAVASSSHAGPSSVAFSTNAEAGPSNYAGASNEAGPSNHAGPSSYAGRSNYAGRSSAAGPSDRAGPLSPLDEEDVPVIY